MSSVNYTVKLDESNKKQAETVLKELGLNLSVAINAYVNTIARQRKIPFSLSLNDTQPTIEDYEEFLTFKSFSKKMAIAEAQAKDENTQRLSLEQVLDNFDSRIKMYE